MIVRRPSVRLAIAGIILTAGLSACTGNSTESAADSPASGSGSPAAAASPASGSPAATSPAPHTDVVVTIADMKFTPSTVRVKVGQTVTWKFQDDGIPHQVAGVRDNALGINSPILKEGEYSFTFTGAGNYSYICSLHPEMRGTVEVS
ncbi:plastocyanin/azurin family copper-binding protein [Skermania piniformis]|uniref:Cupredoxin domain-containing protein n=1 Tax=Skermania pinensis TaxID=39122 RepID=A0ABX8S9U3_9ACTN|nr:plastocyanin/azurin family copper-binding protein [Skermania piniformis]QXQ14635.1 cupredoxin domain-containing protein [Skermania piniformis]